MKKLNDEQLSRVLSAHAEGRLEYLTAIETISPAPLRNLGCLMQVATMTIAQEEPMFSWGHTDFADNTSWFDSEYRPAWSPEEFLAAMQKAGIA